MRIVSRSWIIASLVLIAGWNVRAFGQVECTGEGNLRGIRVDGELMAFSTGIRGPVHDVMEGGQFRRPVGRGRFSRESDSLIVTGGLATLGVQYRAVFQDAVPGTVEVQINSTTNMPVEEGCFVVTLPGADYADGSAELIAPTSDESKPVSLVANASGAEPYLRASAKGVRVTSRRRQIELSCPAPVEWAVKRVHDSNDIEVSFPLSLGIFSFKREGRAAFTIKVVGEVDKSPAKIAVDWSRAGRRYDGMGGNFRIQSPADAAQIQYNLDNLRVAWGRVAMPLDRWQPNEDTDPVEAATAGSLNTSVRDAMEMAQKLAQRNIPTIISVWSAPKWAVGPRSTGQGRPINPEKWDKLCKSIGSYLEYMKKKYGAEPVLFSFNESDMGIYVLQSPQEHAEAIKRLGTYFASRGLKTRMLLGDTGDPTGDKFIDVALADPEAAKYIGAVSFHSWRGGTVEQYTHFSEAARKLDVPLLVAEGGLDPDAFRYRAIFLEPWFCLNEIAEYVKICRIAQPLSILHWQFTADYSILTGGTGGQPLQPAQRFWQIKQLGMTAADSKAVPITCDCPTVSACAFADHGACVVHLVNNGAARTATISGLPDAVKEMRVIVTDARRAMQEIARASVVQGKVELPLEAMSFTSLVGNP
jgi:hypothetical protein